MDGNTGNLLSPLDLYAPPLLPTNYLQLALEPLKQVDDIQSSLYPYEYTDPLLWRPAPMARYSQSCVVAQPAPTRPHDNYRRILDVEWEITVNAVNNQVIMTAGCHNAMRKDLPASSTAVDSARDKMSASTLHGPYLSKDNGQSFQEDTQPVLLPQAFHPRPQDQPSALRGCPSESNEDLNAAMLQLLRTWHERFYALDAEDRAAALTQESKGSSARRKRTRGRRGSRKQKGVKGV
ncbi:uncharacterized protein FIBRA_01777 [Fibroporia radiculosa]|uniref:Uncharacterized protein n=1 Tax=Fibroporia radiculosa TaxID=599839 RepID=J4GLB6_9APHY|nr:uncharacterized protein FIBRA_01777 [Fibroporia radiculosa]CCL99755.1 predicted protein [Fibroporia radiculosa]